MARDFTLHERSEFSDPVVRFRRIKGRIVPIVNKRRVGKMTDRGGTKALKIGAALGAAGLAKKTKIGRKASSLASKGWKAYKGSLPKSKTNSRILKALKKTASLGGKAVFRHTGKTGIALMLGGAAMKVLGWELQARSPYGIDIGGKKRQLGESNE